METSTSVPSFSFGEDLDCRPIYLGKDKSESSFWFYALKGNTARFLKYVNYFHWDRGPQAVLELEPIPKEVEEELEQFLDGHVIYEFVKKRKNSKELSVRKSYRYPCELSGHEPPTRSDTSEHGVPNVGRDGDGSPSARRPHESDAPKRRRRLKSGDAISLALEPGRTTTGVDAVQVGIPAVILPVKIEKKLEEPTSGRLEPLATSEPQGPGKSSKLREGVRRVRSRTDSTSDIGTEVDSEKDHRVELGQLEVLSPTPKKRGRPRKVRLEE